jgi:hypothetical protein
LPQPLFTLGIGSSQKNKNEKDISWVYKITGINPNYLEAENTQGKQLMAYLKKQAQTR